MGAMVPPSRKRCYNFRVTEINRVVDGDTIDVTIDLGFDLYKKERVRVAGVDTPEKRTRDLEEKALGLDATNWMKKNLEDTIDGDEELIIRTELKGGMGKYGRLLGWLYVGDDDVSLNEQMIEEGYAWAYDGGTKQKNFEELREIRRSKGTLLQIMLDLIYSDSKIHRRIIYVFSRWNKQVRWLLTPLIWFKNIRSTVVGRKKIFYKLKLDRLANNPWRRWVESLPMKKRIALEAFST